MLRNVKYFSPFYFPNIGAFSAFNPLPQPLIMINFYLTTPSEITRDYDQLS